MKLEVKVKKILHTDIKTSYRIFKGEIISKELGENEKHLDMALQKTMTFKGYATYCVEGDTFIMDANIRRDKHGMSVYVSNVVLKRIEMISEFERYISKHVKGIGMKTVRKVTDKFGASTLEVIKADDGLEKLMEVVRTKANAKEIRDFVVNNENMFNVMQFLQMHSLDTTIVGRIIEEYGKKHVYDLQGDPYFFVRAIDFKKLDAIASKNPAITAMDIKRLSAGVIAIVNLQAKSKGDVYTNIDTIYQNLESYINANASFEPIRLSTEKIKEAIAFTI